MLGHMGNPARVLHAIYSNWRVAVSSQPQPMYQIINLDTPAGSRVIGNAARALIEIDNLLTQLERSGAPVAVYRRQYPEWWKPLVSQQGGWSTNLVSDNIIGEDHLDEIEGFANFLDGKVWTLSGDRSEALRDLVSRARTALESDAALSSELREYIHRLLQQIEIALDDEGVGATFDYAAAIQRLFVAFKAAESERTPGKGTWASLWTQILSGTVSGAIVQGAIAATNAITSAS